MRTVHHLKHDNNTVRNTVVRARINSDVKDNVENILSQLGLTMSEAISMYMAQIQIAEGIPFAVNIPNKTTLKILADADQGKNVVKAKSVREIFEKAGL